MYALPLLFAITLHEAAHGYVARRLGDDTAYLLGRVTLNPIKHIDIVGTLVVPVVILISSAAVGAGPFLFGWAKPVPVNFNRLRNPRSDMRYVAFAGPGANFFMAFLWAAVFKVLLFTQFNEPFFLEMAKAGIVVNLVLAALNLLPILPLDGGRIVLSFLPAQMAYRFGQTERYGMIVLVALLIFKVLPLLIGPVIELGVGVLSIVFNL